MKNNFSQTKLIFLISLVFVVFYNFTFFGNIINVYPLNSHNIFFLTSIFINVFLATNLVLNILLFFVNTLPKFFKINGVFKRFFSVLFFLAMMGAYVMDSYRVVIDETMFLNVFKTDAKESLDLLTPKLLIYFVLLFLLPTLILYKIKIEKVLLRTEIFSRLKSATASIIIILLLVLSFSKFYASFFREQKPLRYYANPTYWIFSLGKFSSGILKNPNQALEALGRNSFIPAHDIDRELIILVVGETARRDRFSLNGNKHETNPLLKQENVVSFTNVTSCGTSTAISVPCMFSHFGRKNFNSDKANSTENLLDVLQHTKEVNVLWRDNNSDSKGVANRAKFEDYKSSPPNTICDNECRDEGMLVGLQEYIDQVKEKDIVIVLHQMGNHGPAYYKRYPKNFEVFKPVCQTSELQNCTNEEIVNAYDNAILYTDYFLSKVIQLLKNNSTHFNTGMLYVSDHGESLGENGIYLHGLPYIMAPDEQKNVAMIMWFGGNMENETNYVALRKMANEPYSHDNVFHTILGMLDIESSAYDPKMDILHGIHIEEYSLK